MSCIFDGQIGRILKPLPYFHCIGDRCSSIQGTTDEQSWNTGYKIGSVSIAKVINIHSFANVGIAQLAATSEDGFTWTEQGVAVPNPAKPIPGWRSISTPDILVWKGKYFLKYSSKLDPALSFLF